MSTKRQQIIDAVKARMETITIGNAYSSNIGENVFTWRTTNLQASELPAMVIRDNGNSPGAGLLGKFRWVLAVEIDIICSGGSTTADTLREMIKDVYTAIGTDTRWSTLANLTDQPSDDMQITQNDLINGGAAIKFNIEYDTALWSM